MMWKFRKSTKKTFSRFRALEKLFEKGKRKNIIFAFLKITFFLTMFVKIGFCQVLRVEEEDKSFHPKSNVLMTSKIKFQL